MADVTVFAYYFGITNILTLKHKTLHLQVGIYFPLGTLFNLLKRILHNVNELIYSCVMNLIRPLNERALLCDSALD